MAHYIRLINLIVCAILSLVSFHDFYKHFCREGLALTEFASFPTLQNTQEKKSQLAVDDAQKAIEDDYERLFKVSTKPDPNAATLAYYQGAFYSGFRNQAMVFSGFMMYAMKNNFTQILLPTIRWKDLFGTNKAVPHEQLFDIVHWNSYKDSSLPRFVVYDPDLHGQFDLQKRRWNIDNPQQNATMPYAYGKYVPMSNLHKRYHKQFTNAAAKNQTFQQDPVAVALANGALRPHPKLRQHIQKLRGSHAGPYMALHARVEPDMQKHPVCRDKKVLLLHDIFTSLQKQFPDPPFSQLFIAINRPLLERDGNDLKLNNTIAQENLKVLNLAIKEGLWDGAVSVFEAGMPSLVGTPYAKFPGISGSVVDYFLAVDADIFVGTEVSSFSADLISSRFYGGKRMNYHYLPEGLQVATDANSDVAPRFSC